MYSKIKIEGIYYFGGLTQANQINSELQILKIDQKPMKWIIPETKGKPPTPRYSSAMVFYDNLEILIVHGGRLDEDYEKNSFSNDLFVLDIATMNWSKAIFQVLP